MYTKATALRTLHNLGERHEKAVDAILRNQADRIIEKANKIINVQEEIIRRIEEEKKFLTTHQGDNMEEDDHYYPPEK
jgi:hypothetical protein